MSEPTEIITYDEACTRFPDEWVVLEDPEVDLNGAPTRGQLAFHSVDRREAHRRAGECGAYRVAVFYTGKLTGRYVL